MIEMSYTEAMSRIVRQYNCPRQEAYELLKEFVARKHFKLTEGDKN